MVTPQDVLQYMKSLYHAVNAVAELSGPPLHERRLLLEFPSRAEAAQRPGMAAGLYGLLGASSLDSSTLNAWMPEWKLAFESASESSRVDTQIHPARVSYYEKAIQAMLGNAPTRCLRFQLKKWLLSLEPVLLEAARQHLF